MNIINIGIDHPIKTIKKKKIYLENYEMMDSLCFACLIVKLIRIIL
jgi:hypothetical protein